MLPSGGNSGNMLLLHLQLLADPDEFYPEQDVQQIAGQRALYTLLSPPGQSSLPPDVWVGVTMGPL